VSPDSAPSGVLMTAEGYDAPPRRAFRYCGPNAARPPASAFGRPTLTEAIGVVPRYRVVARQAVTLNEG